MTVEYKFDSLYNLIIGDEGIANESWCIKTKSFSLNILFEFRHRSKSGPVNLIINETPFYIYYSVYVNQADGTFMDALKGSIDNIGRRVDMLNMITSHAIQKLYMGEDLKNELLALKLKAE